MMHGAHNVKIKVSKYEYGPVVPYKMCNILLVIVTEWNQIPAYCSVYRQCFLRCVWTLCVYS